MGGFFMHLRVGLSAVVLAYFLTGCGGNSNSDILSGDNSTPIGIDITAVDVQGDYSLNGGAFPLSQYETGIMAFADGENNLASLGETYNNGYAASIVAGTYRSVYLHLYGGAIVPVNRGDTITSGVALNADQTVDIPVTAISVRFAFTLNGGSFPASEYDDAVFYLQPKTGGGESIELGNSHSAVDPVWLMPGTYDVIYSVETSGSQVPLNQHAVVDTIMVDSMTSGATIDVKASDLRFAATLNGGAFPASQYEHALFYLRNTSTGDLVELGPSYELPFDRRVAYGTYDIVYAHQNGASVPSNPDAVLMSGITIDTITSDQSVDVSSVAITPQYSLNGGSFPVSEYQDGEVYLRGSTDEDVLLLSNTHVPSPAAVNIVPGDYDVIYRHETGDQVPQNANAVIQSNVALNSDQVLPVAVNSVDITGTFTLNGKSFPANVYDSARFNLVGANAEDRFRFGDSYEGSSTVRIIPGTYDVQYRHLSGTQVPLNINKVVDSGLLLDTTKAIGVNAVARTIAPTFKLNGSPFPKSIYHYAEFYLRDPSNAGRIFIGYSHLDNDNTMVIKGNYDVLYEYVQGDQVPVNERAVVDNVDI